MIWISGNNDHDWILFVSELTKTVSLSVYLTDNSPYIISNVNYNVDSTPCVDVDVY
jgi:hypothetical protein